VPFAGPATARAATAELRADVHRLLAERLPKEVRGWPTHFHHDDPRDPVGHMRLTAGLVNHRVAVWDIGDWLTGLIGCDPLSAPPTVLDWLAMPQQKLAEAA
jgi:hypothetical protein